MVYMRPACTCTRRSGRAVQSDILRRRSDAPKKPVVSIAATKHSACNIAISIMTHDYGNRFRQPVWRVFLDGGLDQRDVIGK